MYCVRKMVGGCFSNTLAKRLVGFADLSLANTHDGCHFCGKQKKRWLSRE